MIFGTQSLQSPKLTHRQLRDKLANSFKYKSQIFQIAKKTV